MGTSSSRFEKCLRHGDEFAAMQLYQGSGEVRRKLRPNSAIDNLGNTPLHWAARHGMKHLLRALLNDLGGDPNVRNLRLQTALHAVCDAPFHKSPSAVERRAFSVVLVLSWRRRNLAPSSDAVPRSQVQRQPAMATSTSVRTQINAVDVFGFTALHYAVKSGLDQRCLTYLMAHGADPFVRNVAGFTPYDLALRSGLTHLARFLEAKMASLNAVSRTALAINEKKSNANATTTTNTNDNNILRQQMLLVSDTSFVTDDQVGEEARLCDLCFAILGPVDDSALLEQQLRRPCGHWLCRTCWLRNTRQTADKSINVEQSDKCVEPRCPIAGCRRLQQGGCVECEQQQELRVRRGEKALTLDRMRPPPPPATSSSWWTMSKSRTTNVLPTSAPPMSRTAISDDNLLAAMEASNTGAATTAATTTTTPTTTKSRSAEEVHSNSEDEPEYAEVSVDNVMEMANVAKERMVRTTDPQTAQRRTRLMRQRHVEVDSEADDLDEQDDSQLPHVPPHADLNKQRSASLNVQKRVAIDVPRLRLGEGVGGNRLEVSALPPALASAPPFSTQILTFSFPDKHERWSRATTNDDDDDDDNAGFHELLLAPTTMRDMVSMV